MRLTTYRPQGAKEPKRLLTTLTDAAIPGDEIAALYHDRWEVETSIDELKTHQCDCATVNRAVVFRSKTPQRVEQELYGLLIAYNAGRNVMAEVAEEKGLSPLRLSFSATLERVRDCMRDLVLPWQPPDLRIRLMREAIGRPVVPERPARKFSRAVPLRADALAAKTPGIGARPFARTSVVLCMISECARLRHISGVVQVALNRPYRADDLLGMS